MTPDKYLLKDILLTLQAIREFNAERSGVLEAHLIQEHTHQINSHGELLEIRRELRSMRYEVEGVSAYLDEMVGLLRQLNGGTPQHNKGE
jgi:hypothetical protein